MDVAKVAELADYPVAISIPIQWGDQDAFGHVNNVVYFRWYESARIAYFGQTGIRELFDQSGLGPILAAISCSYRRQLNFPDTVQIGARVTRIGRSSMKMDHAIYSHALGEIAAQGESTIVTFDYAANRSEAAPESVRSAIEKLEGGSLSS